MPRFAAITKAFEKGVENVSAEASIKLIEDWQGQLEGYEARAARACCGIWMPSRRNCLKARR
jgi:hypothetical protein